MAALSTAPAALHAQFKIGGRPVQVHGFVSQGYLYSDVNNYLTMRTNGGSFAMTDGGFNASMQVTDKFRIGAQVFDRNVGDLGNWRPSLDWAVADYKFKDWFGIRAGKVKTALGLYNDTQDMEFLHTWALLPQSVYPVDLRGDTIAHTGGDLYGNVELKKLGSLAYTVYGGAMPSDRRGGFVYALERNGRHIESYGGPMAGADLRWTTPLKGLLAGTSFLWQDITADGSTMSVHVPYKYVTKKNHTNAFYAEYTIGNLRIDGEYRRNLKATHTQSVSSRTGLPLLRDNDYDSRLGYLSAAYRISKLLEVGTYHSRFYVDWGVMHGLPSNHIFDQTVTARLDLKSYWDFKIEGHFIDGYASSTSDRGFYSANNPGVKQPNTKLLVVRMGFHF